MTDEDLKLALERALQAANEACRNMEGSLDFAALSRHFSNAIKAERARRDAQTVAWLRKQSSTGTFFADAIERGEHGE